MSPTLSGASTPQRQRPSIGGGTVLHVDDQSATRFARRRILESAGFQVLEAASLNDAWEVVSRERPDVVLTDVQLPDGDGYELTRRIKSHAALATTRVVQVSAVFTNGADRVRGLDSGADAYVIEPTEPAELVAVVRAMMRGRRTDDLLTTLLHDLRQSQQRLQTIIDNTTAVIYLVDPDNRFIVINRRFSELFGLDRPTVAGRSIFDCFPADIAGAFAANNARVWETATTCEFEERVAGADGRERTYLSVKAPLYDASGRPYAVCGVSTDVTEMKRLTEALQAAGQEKDSFIASVAHELRQPIGAIRAALSVMERRISKEKGERARLIIDRQVAQLTRLIDDLLDVSRITRDKITLRKQRLNLGEVLDAAINVVQPAIDERRHRLHVVMPPTTITIDADGDRLQQVFSNLLTNAAKFTDPGGEVTIAVEHDEAVATVHVRDTGCGIAPEALPHIFRMFSQAVDDDRGLGLGLAIARGLVERHGGTIEARSDGPGRGSEFIVRLPLAASQV